METGWAFLQISNKNALLGPILLPNPVSFERKKQKQKQKTTADGWKFSFLFNFQNPGEQ